MPIMEGPNLNGLRGFVRPRRVGLAPPEIPAEAPTPTTGIPTPDMGPAPRPMGDMERAFTAQTPQEQSYQNLQAQGPADPKAGVWERIKGALLSGALAAREAGNHNPEAQGAALLGGLVGGGVSRGFAGNMRHNLVDLPRAKGLAAESRDTADAGLGRRMGFAKTYGYDPESGAPTSDTSRYQEGLSFRDKQLKQEQITDRLKAVLGRPGMTVGAGLAQEAGMPELAGPVPFPPRNPQNLQFQTLDVGGKPVVHYLDHETGQLVPVPTRGGQPATAYQKPPAPVSNVAAQHFAYTQNRDAQKDVQERDKEAKGLSGEYEEAKKAVTLAANTYGQMEKELYNPTGKDSKGNPMPVFNGKAVTQAEVDAAKSQADALQAKYDGVKQRAGEHPNIEFGEWVGEGKDKKFVPSANGTALRYKPGRTAGQSASAQGGEQTKVSRSDPRYTKALEKYGSKADEWLKARGVIVE